MSSSQTFLSSKSGVSSSHTKQRKGLLQDGSWIRRNAEEDDPVDEDPNYGRDVLGNFKTSNYSKSSTTTTKSTVSSTNVTKPPVPTKKPVPTTPTNSFTARVFSGANSSDKVLSPVEKYPPPPKEPPKEPPKTVITSYETEAKDSLPQSTSVTSSRQTIVTYTTPEKAQPSSETSEVTYMKSYEQRSSFGTPTTKTVISTTSYDKSHSNGMDGLTDYLSPSLSPSVQTNPTGTITDSITKSSSSVYKTLPSPSVSPTPVLSPGPRIVGKRDLCSFCAKSIVEGERIILDDLNIYSHTFCFKCEMCYRSLGNLEAGDPLWVHKGRVICASCFTRTKDQWYH